MPRLIVQSPSGLPHLYSIDQDRITIGRSERNDLFVRDESVSRFHVELFRDGGDWMVKDCGSRNGTSLNSERLVGSRPLRPGDRIAFGDTVLVFETARCEAAAGSSSLQPSTRPHTWSGRGTGEGSEELVFVGKTPSVRAILRTIRKFAPSDSTVLITGENGTGKEIVARTLHQWSHRSKGPFQVINCPAMPETLLEAELFGVEKGTATGVEPRMGRIEYARGGTLFLDEVGDMEIAAQAKILRLLEEKTIERIGGRERIAVDIRIVAATNHDLKTDMAKGLFRTDLYHRMNTLSIELPPLRDRMEDVPALVEHFISRSSRPALKMSPEAMEVLMAYSFPGNVRELERLVERAVLLSEHGIIRPSDFPKEVQGSGAGKETAKPGGRERIRDLYTRITEGKESFWTAVHEPFLRRELSREEVRGLIAHAQGEAGRSYKRVARAFRLESEYRKFFNFLYNHDLRSED